MSAKKRKTVGAEPWYAVKCVFAAEFGALEGAGRLYEERITLWKTPDDGTALALAEKEARRYAKETRAEFVGVVGSYHLFDDTVGHGAEIWSSQRDSKLSSDAFMRRFYSPKRSKLSSRQILMRMKPAG